MLVLFPGLVRLTATKVAFRGSTCPSEGFEVWVGERRLRGLGWMEQGRHSALSLKRHHLSALFGLARLARARALWVASGFPPTIPHLVAEFLGSILVT